MNWLLKIASIVSADRFGERDAGLCRCFHRDSFMKYLILAMALLCVAIAPGSASAVSCTWNLTGSGNWAVNSDWSPNSGFPTSSADTAIFGTALTANGTVTVNANESVATLDFNSATYSYTIAGTYTLSVYTSILDDAGNHTISAPISMGGNLVIDVASASNTLTISGNVTGSAKTLTINDATHLGTVIATGTVNPGSTIAVNGGTFQIGNGGTAGSLTGNASVASGATLYFDRSDAYAYTGAITGTGTVKIYEDSKGVYMGGSGNTSLTGFSGTTNLASGVYYLRAANALGSGSIIVGNGATDSLFTQTTTTFSNPITLNGIGGTNDGYAKPAIYGDGGGGTYTLSGQITLAATSDIGNYQGNGALTLSGKITGAGGLVLGKASPTLDDENGTIVISGATSNDYTGGTTINRSTVYLAKTGGAIAIPGNVTISCPSTPANRQAFLILNGSNEIASTAVMSFSGVYLVRNPYFELYGYSQTLAGISDSTGAGVVENTESEAGVSSTGTITINTPSSTTYSFNGYFRDGDYGGSTGKLALVKSGYGTQVLVGGYVSGYTGGTTVNSYGGTLSFGDGTTGAALPGNATVGYGGNITFNEPSGTNYTYSGVISGSGSVSKLGHGIMTLTGANTFTGNINVVNPVGGQDPSQDALILNCTTGAPAVQGNVNMQGGYWLITAADNQFGPNSSVSFTAASTVNEFTLAGHSQTLAGLNDSTGFGVVENGHSYLPAYFGIALPTNTVTLTVNNSTNNTFSGWLRNNVNNDTNSSSGGLLALTKTGTGTLILTGTSNWGANTYGDGSGYDGVTLINQGVLQADRGLGLSNNSTLILNGGILQSNSTISYTEPFWNDCGDAKCLTWWSGGFAGGAGPMTVNLYGDSRTINCGVDGHGGINGTIMLSSPTAQNVVTLQNALNLNGAERTVFVDDNPSSTGDYAVISGTLSGGNYDPGDGSGMHYGGIIKTGPGRLVLTGVGSSYGDSNGDLGRTIISAGVLEAAPGIVPAESCIQLDGGVFQSSGSFTRGWYDMWYTNIITWNNGGFAANGGKLTINIIGDGSTIPWNGNGHHGIAGTMILNSSSAQNEVEIQNPIDLSGGARTLQVDDNPNSSGDFATLSGAITDSVGGASLTKTGAGTLYLTGAASNSYTGGTTFTGGTIYLNKTGGAIAIPGNITVNDGAARTYIILNGTNEIGTSGVFSSYTPIYWADLELNGYSQILAGISNSDHYATISNNTTGSADSTLTVNNSSNYTYYGKLVDRIAGSGTGRLIFVKGGTGTLTLAYSSNTYTGGTTISGGTLQIGDGTSNGVLPGNVTDNATLAYNVAASTSVTYSGAISGTGAFSSLGAGTLTFSGTTANSYSGGTTLSNGRFVLAKSAGVLAIPGNVTINTPSSTSSYLVLNATGQIPTSAVMTFSPSSPAYGYFELYGNSQQLAGISDTTGRGVIENSETESGLATSSALTINSSASYLFNGYIRNYVSGSTGLLSLVKDGSGTLTLSGVNSGGYSGGLTVKNGTLDYSGGSLPGLANSVYCPYTITGGTLNIGAVSQNSIGTFQITGGTVTGTTGVLTSNAAYDIQAGTVNVSLGGSGIALNKTGTGTATLSGTVANTYSGVTTVSNGVLLLSKSSGAVAIAGNITIASPGTSLWGTVRLGASNQIATSSVITFAPAYANSYGVLELHGNAQTVAGISDSTGLGIIENTQADTGIGGGTLTINNTTNYSYNGYIRDTSSGTGALSLVKNGTGTLTMSNQAGFNYTGGLMVSGGVLEYSGGYLPSCPYVVNGGTLSIGTKTASITSFQITSGAVNGTGTLTSSGAYDVQAGTVNAVLAGSVGLNKTTSGAATVNAPTYTGTTTDSLGTLNFTGGLPSGNYVINGGTLNINALTKNIGTFQISSGTLTGTGALTSSTAYDVQGGTINAVLAGSVGLNKTTAGTATISTAPTYTGTTSVSAGSLSFASGGGLPGGNYVVSGGTLDIDSLSKSIGTFQITGGTVSGTAGVLTSSGTYDIQAGTVNAILAGSGIALTKSGSGTATLGGADTYSGATTISQGTLALGVSGSFANSATISVASLATLDLTAKTSSFNFGAGQTLKGFGTVNIGSGKTIGFTGGGTLAPGGSIGTLNITGNLDLTGGTAAFELGTPGTSHTAVGTSDLSAVTGNLTLGGTLNLIDNAGANSQGTAGVGSYKIFTYTGTESGSFAAVTGWASGKHVAVVNVSADKAVYVDAYNYATVNTLTTPINFGSIHTGGSKTQSLSVQNTASSGAFTEALAASFGTPSSGFTATGSIAGLAGQTSDTTSMLVGISGATAGHKSGTVAVNLTSKAGGGSGLSDTTLTAQTLTLTGDVYNYAAANTLATPVNFGAVHAGDSFSAQALLVQNTAPSGDHTEGLAASFGTPSSGFTATGSIAGLAGGASDNTSMVIGVSEAMTGGHRSGTVTVNFTSKAVGGSGLSDTTLTSQTLALTGDVYNYAAANTLSTPISFGSIHAGSSFGTQTVAVQNTAPSGEYTEGLAAGFGTPSSGITATGSIAGLAGGASDNASMVVGISDTTAGHKSGTVAVNLTSKAVGGSGLSDTALTAQTVTLTGDVYNYAAPNAIASPGNVGKFYKNALVNRLLTVANLAPGFYSEGLNASFGAPSGGMSAIGSVMNLTGADNTSLALSLDTFSAGAKSGSVIVNLVSNGTNSGLADTDLASQWVSMSAEVYDHGVASFDGASEVSILHLTLSGSLGETVSQQYSIYNLLQTAGFTGKLDLLDFSGVGDTTQIDSGLSSLLDLEAGSSTPFTATLNTGMLGSYSADYTLDLADSASEGISGGVEHQTLHLQITGEVVPEPSTLVLLTVGLIGLLCCLRRRCRV